MRIEINCIFMFSVLVRFFFIFTSFNDDFASADIIWSLMKFGDMFWKETCRSYIHLGN